MKNKNKTIKVKEGIGRKIDFYGFLFFIYAVAGWIYEVALGFYYGVGFDNRGFLFGPYLPIYGFGGLLLFLVLGKIVKKKMKVWKINLTPVLVFLLIVVLTTVLEYAGAVIMERGFHLSVKDYWDYSDEWMNLNGYICPLASFRFGVLGMVFLYGINPVLEKVFGKIGEKYKGIMGKGMIGVLVLDLILTIIFRR